ncbi:MAG: alpha/beta hydrolase [Parvibaculum sp.]
MPPLHFAHANGFNGMTYRHLLAPLADRFHIRAWDARGHGASSLAADPLTQTSWYRYADDLIALLEHFADEAGGPVLLAGHSMGGATSILAAARRPDLVRGIVLLDPVMIRRHHGRILQVMTRLGLRVGPQDLAAGAEKRRSIFPDRQTMVESYRGRGIFRTWPEEFLVDYVEGGTRILPTGEVELACAPAWEAANFRGHDHDIFAGLAKVTVPLSLIYAGIGSTCRGNAPFLIGEQDKRATLLRIGTGTHFLPVEYPEIVQREIISLHQRIETLATQANL